jgi:selenophosphate synthetase-related protein
MKVINARLPTKILADTDKMAKQHGVTRSEVIRQALIMYMHLVENVGTMIRPPVFQAKPSQISYSHRGDVTIMKMPTGHAIVSGSTSSGAIGPKPGDQVKVDGTLLGRFLARVALMDVISTGAFPLLLSATLSVEKEPLGQQILQGIKQEASTLGIDTNQAIMENTEDNFTTNQTGAGLTVIGLANEADLRIGKTCPGDLVIALGKPKVGLEVLKAQEKGEIADLRNVEQLTQKKYVHDIMPVGAFGIASEAKMLAYSVGKQFKIDETVQLDLVKSAGPATVILASIEPKKVDELKMLIQKPITVIGEIL